MSAGRRGPAPSGEDGRAVSEPESSGRAGGGPGPAPPAPPVQAGKLRPEERAGVRSPGRAPGTGAWDGGAAAPRVRAVSCWCHRFLQSV